MADNISSNGVAALVVQVAPLLKGVLDRIKPVLDQPVIRFPYVFPGSASRSIAAGQTGVRLTDSDFLNALEWPFEIHAVKFSNDASHTFRDWRVNIKDQTFNQDWMKTQSLVADLVQDNTGQWQLLYPWVVRPKGGGLAVTVDNLDAQNAIRVDVAFIGYLLIPRS